MEHGRHCFGMRETKRLHPPQIYEDGYTSFPMDNKDQLEVPGYGSIHTLKLPAKGLLNRTRLQCLIKQMHTGIIVSTQRLGRKKKLSPWGVVGCYTGEGLVAVLRGGVWKRWEGKGKKGGGRGPTELPCRRQQRQQGWKRRGGGGRKTLVKLSTDA